MAALKGMDFDISNRSLNTSLPSREDSYTQGYSLCEDLPSSNSIEDNYSFTIGEVLPYLYKKNLHTDVEFRVLCGDGYISFRCHKLVLAMWSPVFEDKFFNKKSQFTNDTVEVSGVPPSAFEVIIKFCYGFKTELHNYKNDIKFLLKVYKGATVYKIKGLQTKCCEMFTYSLPTKENVFELLLAARFIGSECLELRCHKVLQTHTKEILQSRDIHTISKSVIITILSMPTLSLDSEYELITWLFDWGSHNFANYKDATFRSILMPFLPNLNFLSLKPNEFGQLVSNHDGFFDEKEGFAIFMNIVCPGSCPLPPWCCGSSRSFTSESDSIIA